MSEPLERDNDLPLDVKRDLMDAAVSNGRISYHWLCDVYRRGLSSRLPQAEGERGNTAIDDVPAWIQIQGGSELSRLVEVVRVTLRAPNAESVKFLHSDFDAAGLLWRWALKWFRPVSELATLREELDDLREKRP